MKYKIAITIVCLFSSLLSNTIAAGEKHYSLKEYDKALAVFLKLYKTDKTNLKILNNISVTYRKLKDITNARKFANKALKNAQTDKEKGMANYNIALTYLDENKKIEAIKYLQNSLKLRANKHVAKKLNLLLKEENRQKTDSPWADLISTLNVKEKISAASKTTFELFLEKYSIVEKTKFKLLQYDTQNDKTKESVIGELDEENEVVDTFQSSLYIVDINNDSKNDLILTKEGSGTLKVQQFQKVLINQGHTLVELDFYGKYFNKRQIPLYFQDDLFTLKDSKIIINFRDDWFFNKNGESVEMWQADQIEKEISVLYSFCIIGNQFKVISIVSNKN